MYLSLSFFNWLSYFVLFQGLLFGTMLMLLHSTDNRPTFFLGVFVLLFSVVILPQSFLNDIVFSRGTEWKLGSVNFYLITYPLFYLYIQKISNLEHKQLSYWTLIPGVIELIIVSFLYFLPLETVLPLRSNFLDTVYVISTLGYCMYISILILKWTSSYFKKLGKQYTSINENTLAWVKWFVFGCMTLYFVKVLNLLVFIRFNQELLFLIGTGLIYWVTYKGITQKTNVSLISCNVIHQDLMPEDEALELLGTVEAYIEESNCYMNDTFTIVDLAEAIHVHPKRISYAINSIKGIHFNKYINFFRVNYAKVLLKSNAVKRLSIEGIGIEAGFHSKTTFYKAFKSFEGMTPAKYKMS